MLEFKVSQAEFASPYNSGCHLGQASSTDSQEENYISWQHFVNFVAIVMLRGRAQYLLVIKAGWLHQCATLAGQNDTRSTT